ncbi:hypothetical protein [Methanobrevibacter sp. YE315]|uniref:hypothetical protein n=1 Tax=Methanobrevibacter sp. YE315 TaxID=1609968 RepID=UPI0012DE4153|nr:hypothetical protein [Methanobrevibacter sp. YE315]
MRETKYVNLFRSEGVFEFIYLGDGFKIEAKDWNDLKFKLAFKNITLQEKTSEELNKKTVRQVSSEKKIKNSKIEADDSNISKQKPMVKNKDYIESEDDVNFGKITHVDLKGGVYTTWGPDNSKRAKKLRKSIIR